MRVGLTFDVDEDREVAHASLHDRAGGGQGHVDCGGDSRTHRRTHHPDDSRVADRTLRGITRGAATARRSLRPADSVESAEDRCCEACRLERATGAGAPHPNAGNGATWLPGLMVPPSE